jgi:hypothetical protein
MSPFGKNLLSQPLTIYLRIQKLMMNNVCGFFKVLAPN